MENVSNLNGFEGVDINLIRESISVKFGFVALVVFLYILYYFAKPALLYKKLWFSELALLNIFSQLGYMMTQSQFAHQQSIVFFTVLLYIFHSQIKKTNPS
mgnify:CR=1 FL=1